MVQMSNYKKSSRLWEAKTFLIIRALQRAYHRSGKKIESNEYRKAVRKEFELKKVKFQMDESKKENADFLCFQYLAVFIYSENNVTMEDEIRLQHYLKSTNLSTGLILFPDAKGLNIKKITIS